MCLVQDLGVLRRGLGSKAFDCSAWKGPTELERVQVRAWWRRRIAVCHNGQQPRYFGRFDNWRR